MKSSQHRNDEPTILPADCSAILFRPDGGVEMFFPARPRNEKIDAGTYNVMRCALLFGDGPDCDEVRAFVDGMVDKKTAENRKKK